jgi:hypothetical protein
MKAADGQHQSLIPAEMWRGELCVKQVETGEEHDDDHVGDDAANRLVAIARNEVKKAGEG